MDQTWPVFGLSDQREMLFQSEVNILKQHVSEIVVVLEAIDAEILLIYDQVSDIVADLNWLNANALSNIALVSTYNSISCPGYPVVDLFGPPTTTALNPGVSVVINARPLISLDDTVLVSYDATCGFVNIQDAGVFLGTTGLESLVAVATAPNFELKSLVAGSGIVLTPGLTDIAIDYTGSNIALLSAGAGLSLVSDAAGPDMAIKGLVAADATATVTGAATEVTLATTGSNITLSSAGGTVSLVSDGAGPDLGIRGLTGGVNIDISSTAGPAVTISRTQTNLSYGNYIRGGLMTTFNAKLTWVTMSAGAWGVILSSADMQVFNTNYIRYTGAVTKAFEVSAWISIRNTAATVVQVFFSFRLNSVTVLPAVTTATVTNTILYNPLIIDSTILMATNDFFELVLMIDTAAAVPLNLASTRLYITIKEI